MALKSLGIWKKSHPPGFSRARMRSMKGTGSGTCSKMLPAMTTSYCLPSGSMAGVNGVLMSSSPDLAASRHSDSEGSNPVTWAPLPRSTERKLPLPDATSSTSSPSSVSRPMARHSTKAWYSKLKLRNEGELSKAR